MALASNGPDFQGDNETLSTTAELIYTAGNRASATEPETITVQNLDSSIIVTVGGADVASLTNGIVLGNQYDSVTIPLRSPGAVVYAIAASGTPAVSITRA